MPPRHPAPEPEPLLTTGDVCRRPKVGKSSVYRLAAEGRLPVLRVRRAMRFPRAGLDAYLAEVLVPAVPSSATTAVPFPTASTAKECPR